MRKIYDSQITAMATKVFKTGTKLLPRVIPNNDNSGKRLRNNLKEK